MPARKALPIKVTYPVTLSDFYLGKKGNASISIQTTCPGCQGKGTKDGKQAPSCPIKGGGCGGKGKILKHRQIGPGMVQQMVEDCSACQGTGEILKKENACATCQGKKQISTHKILDFEIEPGMRAGQTIVLTESGNSLPPVTGSRDIVGDIHICLTEEEDENDEDEKDQDQDDQEIKITRNEEFPCDLQMVKKITLLQALLGHSFSFRHLDNRQINCSVPKNHFINNTESMILPNLGMPILKKYDTYGDLIVHFEVMMPSTTLLDHIRSPKVSTLLRDILLTDEEKLASIASTVDEPTASAAENLADAVEGVLWTEEENEKREKARSDKKSEENDDDDHEKSSNNGQPQCRQM
jgi:DnaJ family protein A protein 2